MANARAWRTRWSAVCATMAVAVLVVAAAATPAAAVAADRTSGAVIIGADDPDTIAGSYIAVFRDSSQLGSAAQLRTLTNQLATAYGATVTHTYTAALPGFAARMSEDAAKQLAADPAVDYVVADHRVRTNGTQVNPPSWGLDRIDQRDLPLNQRYTYPTTASNVHMYIIDTGIRVTHQDFGGRASFDFNSVDNINTDCHGHGTQVAGVAGGSTYGVAKGVRLHAVKALGCNGEGTTNSLIAAIDWLTIHRIRPAVANISGSGLFNQALNQAVVNLMDAGVTLVVSAGNSNTSSCQFSPQIAGGGRGIGVGATTITDARAAFSNWGACVDMYAPGQSIVTTSNASDTDTTVDNGTSLAAPHAAGVAALYLASHPSASAQQVHDAVVFNSSLDRLTGIISCCGSAGQSTNRALHSTFQPPAPGNNALNRGQQLAAGQSIRSHRGNHVLVMQPDGNLVHYQGSKPLWTTDTGGNPGAYAQLQHDGNFVLYRSNGTPLWATNTENTSANQLIMQDDGNIVLYGPLGAGRPGVHAHWASR